MSFHGIVAVIGLANFLFGFGIGVPMTYWAVRRHRTRDEVLERVESVTARITTSRVERVRNPGRGPKYKYRPVVRFRYSYRGRTYESNRRAYNMLFGKTSEPRAERTADRYLEGKRVTAYVDPENPDKGFLDVEETRQNLSMAFFLVIGVVMILAGFAGAGLLGFVLFGL